MLGSGSASSCDATDGSLYHDLETLGRRLKRLLQLRARLRRRHVSSAGFDVYKRKGHKNCRRHLGSAALASQLCVAEPANHGPSAACTVTSEIAFRPYATHAFHN
jgi:hypothetical protein